MKPDPTISAPEFKATATQTEHQAPLAGHVASRIAAGDLSGYFGLLPNPDPVLRQMGKSIDVYRSMLVDPLIKGIRRRRASAVLSMERGLDKEKSKGTSQRAFKAVEALVDSWDMQRMVREQIDGAFFGYRVSEVMWGQFNGMAAPVDVIAKPSEWFGFHPETGELRFRPNRSSIGKPVPGRKFTVTGKMRSWENPYGEPDLAACFWPVTFKRGGMKFWVTFTEKYGMPWAVGKQPRSASPKETEELADKLAAMVRDAVAVIPDDASVELLQAAGTANAQMFENLLMFCRSEISIALLGNNQSVEMQSNKASATAAQSIEKDLRDDDAQMVAATLQQAIDFFCEVQFPGVKAPVYHFWEQEEVDEVLAKRDETLRKAGAHLSTEYFKRSYNLQAGDLEQAPEGELIHAGADNAGNKVVPIARARRAAGGSRSFADPAAADTIQYGGIPVDQATLDAAIAQLPADELGHSMEELLAPALKAISFAETPEQVHQALVDAWPEMDASKLEHLMERAYFVSDLVGRDSVQDPRE